MTKNTDYIKERYTAKYIAEVLKIKVSTLRKYSALLEKYGYKFTKSNQNHRSYSARDIKIFTELMSKKNDTDMTLEQAANFLMNEMMGKDGTGINSKKSLSDGENGQQRWQECLKCQKKSRKLLLELLNQNTVLHRKARGN